MGAALGGRACRVSGRDGIGEQGVAVVIGPATVIRPQPEHLDHRLPHTRGEAVEQLEQDRVVGRRDDAAMERGVGIDMRLDPRGVGPATDERSTDESEIGCGAARRNLTEPDYVLDLCDAITTLWDATPERPVILNLPATVEVATPNVYADQIEYMHRNLARREGVILSVHPHNDRGTGVACAELAVLAGAERVEGCVFGNGERTGNVDLATLALNLHAQGVDPMIDFSDLDEIRRTVEHCNGIEVHPRHPYVGDLVHTAFSGTHQDAIRKGLAEHRSRTGASGADAPDQPWLVPYLPIDPADLGRSYDAVIRVNSQSGKGGIAYLLEKQFGIELPRRLQIEFAKTVQAHADSVGDELTATDLWALFERTYLPDPASDMPTLASYRLDGSRVHVTLRSDSAERTHRGVGPGPVESLVSALVDSGITLEVLSLHQTSLGAGSTADALTLLEYRDAHGTRWTAGRAASVLDANVDAVMRAASLSGRTSSEREGCPRLDSNQRPAL